MAQVSNDKVSDESQLDLSRNDAADNHLSIDVNIVRQREVEPAQPPIQKRQPEQANKPKNEYIKKKIALFQGIVDKNKAALNNEIKAIGRP